MDDLLFFRMEGRSKQSHHLFQFQVWKKSMKAKFITEAVFLVALTAVFQYFLVESLNSGHELLGVYHHIVNLHGTQADIDAALLEHSDAAVTFMDDMEITEYLSIVAFFYPLRVVLESVFAKKTFRPMRFFTLNNLLDFAFAVCFAIRFWKEHTAYREGMENYDTHEEQAVQYFENIYQHENDEVLLDVLYTVAIGALWVRILYMFRLTRFLGPLLNMVYIMIWDIFIFMILFGIILVIYASVGNLLFYTEEPYSTFWESVVTLFGSALGNFDLTQLDDSGKGKLVGELYIISFVVMCNILTLNLLIAILSSTYAILEEKKLVLYINEILKLRNVIEYHHTCGGLTSAAPPWNVFGLIASPIYVLKSDTRKLDKIILLINYIPILVGTVFIFIFINLLLLPLTYVKNIVIKFQFIFDKRLETTVRSRVFTLIIFISLGGVIVMLNLIVDLYVFVLHLYQSEISYRKEKSKVQYVSSETYKKLHDKFKKDHKDSIEAVTFIEMSTYSRAMMKVTPILRALIFSKSIKNMSFEKQIFTLQEYSKIKNTMDCGSIKHTNRKLIFPMIWNLAMNELKINSKIRKILDFNKDGKDRSTSEVSSETGCQDLDKDYLKQFLNLSMGEVYSAANKLDMSTVLIDNFKEMLEKMLVKNENFTNKGQQLAHRPSLMNGISKRRLSIQKQDNSW